MLTFSFYTCLVLFILVCLILILLILIQKGRGGGLASAFGGAGGNTAFGSKTGDVLTWATSIVFGVFVLLAIALNLIANARHNALVAGGAVSPPPVKVPAGGTSNNTPVATTPPAAGEPGVQRQPKVEDIRQPDP